MLSASKSKGSSCKMTGGSGFARTECKMGGGSSFARNVRWEEGQALHAQNVRSSQGAGAGWADSLVDQRFQLLQLLSDDHYHSRWGFEHAMGSCSGPALCARAPLSSLVFPCHYWGVTLAEPCLWF